MANQHIAQFSRKMENGLLFQFIHAFMFKIIEFYNIMENSIFVRLALFRIAMYMHIHAYM